jgi:arsenate reductase
VLTAEAVEVSDVVITMGCGDTCPTTPGTRHPLPGLAVGRPPAGQGVEAVRPIRDQIRANVEQHITELLPVAELS